MRPPGVTLRKRMVAVFLGVMLSFVLLAGRLAWIQFVKGEELRAEALETRTREVQVQPRRGTIYDRMGRELAVSVNADSIYAIPIQVKDPVGTAAVLAEVLEQPREELEQKLTRNLSFVWIQRKVDRDKSRLIRERDLPGIYFTQESRRYYPKKELLAHVLGFAGVDSQGLEGIEVTYDEMLRGVSGRIVVEFDARGREIPQAIHRYYPPEDGFDLYLTVDETIQYIAERELEKALVQHSAEQGIVLAMDPHNGEILAMAVRPAFDPNIYQAFSPKAWRNPVISDTFAPGSVFKPLTAAAGLDSGIITPQTAFWDPGSVKVPGAVISNWNNRGLGDTNFAEGFKKSANVVFVKAALMVGMDRFYHYLDAFGLMGRTGIDLPGEAGAIIPARDQARPVDLAVMSFGQTLTVTPIQMATIVAAAANGGYLVVPHVAREFRDKEGNLIKRVQTSPRGRAVSEETAAQLRQLMELVVESEDGTGTRARVEGYRVAGKTGTANKVIGGRLSEDRYLASFIGFAPAEDPKVLLYVMIDEPKGIPYGGWVAAPVFASIMRDILHYLEVPPSHPEGDTTPEPGRGRQEGEEQKKKVPVPTLLNLALDDARVIAGSYGLTLLSEGGGNQVLQQVPSPGVMVEVGTRVLVKTQIPSEPVPSGEILVTVPSVQGMTIRSAAAVLGQVGLRLVPEGTGLAVNQEPRAGTRVAPRTDVKVQFRAQGATSAYNPSGASKY